MSILTRWEEDGARIVHDIIFLVEMLDVPQWKVDSSRRTYELKYLPLLNPQNNFVKYWWTISWSNTGLHL